MSCHSGDDPIGAVDVASEPGSPGGRSCRIRHVPARAGRSTARPVGGGPHGDRPRRHEVGAARSDRRRRAAIRIQGRSRPSAGARGLCHQRDAVAMPTAPSRSRLMPRPRRRRAAPETMRAATDPSSIRPASRRLRLTHHDRVVAVALGGHADGPSRIAGSRDRGRGDPCSAQVAAAPLSICTRRRRRPRVTPISAMTSPLAMHRQPPRRDPPRRRRAVIRHENAPLRAPDLMLPSLSRLSPSATAGIRGRSRLLSCGKTAVYTLGDQHGLAPLPQSTTSSRRSWRPACDRPRTRARRDAAGGGRRRPRVTGARTAPSACSVRTAASPLHHAWAERGAARSCRFPDGSRHPRRADRRGAVPAAPRPADDPRSSASRPTIRR